jgi:transcriptional regulator GlxA family with amidase domain
MSQRLEFNPQMNLQGGPMGNHYRLIQFLLDELERENSFLGSPLAVVNYEQSVLTSLLLGQPNTYSTQLSAPASPIASHQVRNVEAFLEGHANHPLDLPTLVRETGYSVNSIYRAFRKYRPYSPMDFLKHVRLKNVRRELLNAPPHLTVTKVATDWGFTHLGRFSAEYKKKFGESPSETSKRAQQKWD